jgi:hypothetical protein
LRTTFNVKAICMRQFISLSLVCAALGVSAVAQQPAAPGPLTAIRAGRLLDPEAGRVLTNQIILIEGTRIPRRRVRTSRSRLARRRSICRR